MKNLTCIVFLFLSTLTGYSQELKDKLITVEGDTTFCNITLVNDNWIYYDHKVKKSVRNDYIHKDDIKEYFYNNEWVIPYHPKPKIYSEVIMVDSSISKNELFSSFMDWVAKYYVSAQNVIQYQDKEEGKIVIKALSKVYCNGAFGESESAGVIHYTISIYVKNGKYKYEITNIYHEGNSKYQSGGSIANEKPDSMLQRSQWVKIKSQAESGINKTILNLKESATNIKSSEDW